MGDGGEKSSASLAAARALHTYSSPDFSLGGGKTLTEYISPPDPELMCHCKSFTFTQRESWRGQLGRGNLHSEMMGEVHEHLRKE